MQRNTAPPALSVVDTPEARMLLALHERDGGPVSKIVLHRLSGVSRTKINQAIATSPSFRSDEHRIMLTPEGRLAAALLATIQEARQRGA